MDLMICFHEIAPIFVMTYTAMSPYMGSTMGETYVMTISRDGLQSHKISGI